MNNKQTNNIQTNSLQNNNTSIEVATRTSGPVDNVDELKNMPTMATNAKELPKDPNIINTTSKESNLKRDTKVELLEDNCDPPVFGQRYSKPPNDLLKVQDYFKKPVLIGTISWTTSVATQQISPYTAWEALAVVNSRFSYFNRRSYNLKVSFSLVGSPYHVGMVLVDWNPSSRGPLSTSNQLVGAQRRHVVLTAQSSYVELDIPHWSSTPYIVGSAPNAGGRGVLNFNPLVPLLKADGTAPGTITIQIRAWTDDMVQSEPSFTQTSGIVRGAVDFGKTVVSLADKFVSAADWVANLLGFSVKTDYQSMAMVPSTAPNLSSCEGWRPANTLNVYQDNMILPYNDCTGEVDNLLFRSMTSRPGLLQVYTMTSVQTVGTVIFNIPIHPLLCIGNRVSLLPIGAPAITFSHWCGSINFAVQIISSPLQQASLLIAHEPSSAVIPASGNNSQAASTARSCIMDITESTYKVFTVSSAGGSQELLTCATPRTDPLVTPANPLVQTTDAAVAGKHAGYLTMSINKPLISPGASSLYILLWMYAGPDFQLVDFNGEHLNQFFTTSLAVKGTTDDPLLIKNKDTCDLRIHTFRDIRKTHSGEEILSWRALLQRYNLCAFGTPFLKSVSGTVKATLYETATMTVFYSTQNRGMAGVPAGIRAQPLYDITDLYTYVSSHFARATGGQRLLAVPSYRTTSNSPQLAYMSPTDIVYADGAVNNNEVNLPTTTNNNMAGDLTAATAWVQRQQFFGNGAVLQDLRSNPVLHAEHAQVTASPFLADISTYAIYGMFRDVYLLDTTLHVYRAAKADVNFYEFTGCPTIGFSQYAAATTTNATGSSGLAY